MKNTTKIRVPKFAEKGIKSVQQISNGLYEIQTKKGYTITFAGTKGMLVTVTTQKAALEVIRSVKEVGHDFVAEAAPVEEVIDFQKAKDFKEIGERAKEAARRDAVKAEIEMMETEIKKIEKRMSEIYDAGVDEDNIDELKEIDECRSEMKSELIQMKVDAAK